MEGEPVTPKQIKARSGKNRTDRVCHGDKQIGETQDAAKRTVTEKVCQASVIIVFLPP